jgi:hypothetical protein
MIFALPDNPTEGVSDTRREYKDVQKKADLWRTRAHICH